MLRKKMAIVSFILASFIYLCLYQMVVLRPSDIEQFRQMIQKKEIASSQAPLPTNQLREGVCKEIWFSQDDCRRLHYKIASSCSVLTLTPVENRFELVESLDGVKCLMQDKVIHKDNVLSQQVRYVEADSGTYRHTSQEFSADGVTLSLFNLPGETLPTDELDKNTAFLQGIAKEVSFLFSGKSPQFQAKHFQATMVKE